MPNDAIGIVGVDGQTPIYRPYEQWCMWSIHEIYQGQEGLNKFIPKVLDYVVEPESGNLFKVDSLDPVTYIPNLSPVGLQQEYTVDQIITTSAEDNRVYYDKSVLPWTLAVDGFLRVYSSAATYARIYQGSFIDPTKIISRRYNNSGVFIGHDIPLEVVAMNSHDNYAIKSIPACNTETQLQDGETVTIVIFNSNGKVLKRATAIIEETTYVAQAYAEQKYITQIYLKSAFIADTGSDQINYPVNLPVQSFNPIGVVQFNDGSQIEYPVDGDKFRLYGLDQFVSTIIGHKVPLVLSYRMASNESGLASVTSDGHYITRPFELVVSSPNTSYNVKLYTYPVWIDAINGYKLKTYLMNLDRNVLFDVSNLVGLATNSPAFNATGYGITQRLIFTINLTNVSSIFNPFQHVQTEDIVLRGPANDDSINNIWEVASQVPTPVPYYGTNLRITVDAPTRKKISLHNNKPTLQDFINSVYKTTTPLYNPVTELSAPVPTHLEVMYANESVIVDINNYMNQIQMSNPISHLHNVDIVFLKQTTSGYLKLSVCSMVCR